MTNGAGTVLLFPGQGSQHVGMGADVAGEFSEAAAIFRLADQILGYAISQLCFDGPAAQLDQTQYTQPALYVTGMAMLSALQALHGDLQPVAAAGHSLGEFTALTASGALSFEDGLKLVAERGRLMAEAGGHSPGGMAALLGANLEDVQSICQEASQQTGAPVVIGNDNCPGQVVISGNNAAVDKALELAKARGVRRAVRLAVSVATHSPLMAYAASAFRAAVDAVPLQTPRLPVIGNASAAPLHTVEDIRAELNAQLVSTVRWSESITTLIGMGGTRFLEIGPKDVLTGLLKRIDKDAVGMTVNSTTALRTFTNG